MAVFVSLFTIDTVKNHTVYMGRIVEEGIEKMEYY
jgi:hypothetical protein